MPKGDKVKRIKPKLGDVLEIPLPNGAFAYGRLYNDAGFGVYNKITESPKHPPIGLRDFLFNVGIYDDIARNGEWEIVGNDPFGTDECTYPPPTFILDSLSGEYSIYYKGEIVPASESECAGLEETAVWDSHHIIERILNEGISLDMQN